jgi:N-succinyldiaminopimelate aminotransferase
MECARDRGSLSTSARFTYDGGRFSQRFVRTLAEEAGVVCTPMSVFYGGRFADGAPCTLVRFTICKSREHIERACRALAQ